MSTRVAICDGHTFNIVGVDVICRWLESISGVVLVAPSLSTDLAVADAVNRVCDISGRWMVLSLTLKVSRGSAHQQNHHHGGDGGSRCDHYSVSVTAKYLTTGKGVQLAVQTENVIVYSDLCMPLFVHGTGLCPHVP